MTSKTRRLQLWLGLAVTIFSSGLTALFAHEIPNDVTVRLIVRPQGDRLDVLARVPLEAMQDIQFPTVGPGFLDVPRADRALRDAATVWLRNEIELFENGEPLPGLDIEAVRASIPSDRSFTSHSSALEHLRGPPLPAGTQLVWQQALLDVRFSTPIADPAARFSILPSLERLGQRVVTVVRFESPDGRVRLLQLDAVDTPVALDPSWAEASIRFVAQGFEHILDGADHLLFLLCLVLPLRRNLGSLVLIVTAFTIAHSITLAASAYGLAPDRLWFPPLVETLIAASIFYMALETVLCARMGTRWPIAFGFGLVHGFGFSFALRDTLQFAGDHVATALLSFNLGVELGQLLVVVVLVAALNVLFQLVSQARVVTIVVSVIVAHTAWHWMLERFAVLRAYPIAWRDVAEAGMEASWHWLLVALLLTAVLVVWMRRRRRPTERWR